MPKSDPSLSPPLPDNALQQAGPSTPQATPSGTRLNSSSSPLASQPPQRGHLMQSDLPQPDLPQSDLPQQSAGTGKRFFLGYDILMMGLISLNLLIMAMDHLLFSHLGSAVAHVLGQGTWLSYYQQHWHQRVADVNDWFTVYLLAELLVRWAIAVIYKHHYRWFFFPFVHWYEFLAIIPALRALRLLRVFVIGYRLYQLGYHVIPKNILKKLLFYYEVVLEELSDRIVVSILDGVERELKTPSSNHLVQQLIEQHRSLLNQALAETLQQHMATALHTEQRAIVENVGQIVSKSIANTPELHYLLRLIPVVGGRIEQQIQHIGKRLGENITAGLVAPLIEPAPGNQPANPTLQTVSQYISQIHMDQPAMQQLVSSLVFESLNTIRTQVKIQHWKLKTPQ